MDREISAREIRKTQLRLILRIAIGIIAAVMVLFALRQLIRPRLARSYIVTARAEIGTIEGTVTASGTVIPAYEQLLSSPFASRIDSVYRSAGDLVKPGDAIVRLDTQFMLLQQQQLQDELALMQNNRRQRTLAVERTRIQLQSDYDIMQLQVQAYDNELAIQQQLFALGGGMQTAVDKARLNRDIAQLQLQQLAQRMQNEELALAADLADIDLRLSIKNNELTQLNRRLELAQTKAQFNGVVTWVHNVPGATVQQGETVARIADLSHFKVRGSISDYHADKLHTGNPAYISIGDTRLDGTISAIEPTSEHGIITFYIELNQSDNPLLRSNLRTDISIITTSKANVVRLKNGPAINGRGRMNLFVIQGTNAIRRPVTVGEINLHYAEILTGIQPDEEVIISDMQRYENNKTIVLTGRP
jgi:HlyD family secretion protein